MAAPFRALPRGRAAEWRGSVRQNWAEHRRESARLSHPATIGPRCYRASLGVTQGSSLGRRVGSEKSVILTSVVGEKASVPNYGVDVCDGCHTQVVPEFGATQRFTQNYTLSEESQEIRVLHKRRYLKERALPH